MTAVVGFSWTAPGEGPVQDGAGRSRALPVVPLDVPPDVSGADALAAALGYVALVGGEEAATLLLLSQPSLPADAWVPGDVGVDLLTDLEADCLSPDGQDTLRSILGRVPHRDMAPRMAPDAVHAMVEGWVGAASARWVNAHAIPSAAWHLRFLHLGLGTAELSIRRYARWAERLAGGRSSA